MRKMISGYRLNVKYGWQEMAFEFSRIEDAKNLLETMNYSQIDDDEHTEKFKFSIEPVFVTTEEEEKEMEEK